MKFMVPYILKGFKPFSERTSSYPSKEVNMNLKVATAIIFFSDSNMLFECYWNYLKLWTRSCHNLLCSQSSALLVPVHLF